MGAGSKTGGRPSSRDRALDLAKRGICVFPVGKNKKPLTKKGQFSENRWSASNDIGVVHNAFKKYPNADIGIATGESGLVVIDVDKKSGGLDWYHYMRSMLGCGYIVWTINGGLHLYYCASQRSEIRNSASLLAPGVDVRGQGGFVVAYDDVVHGSIDAITPMPDWLVRKLA